MNQRHRKQVRLRSRHARRGHTPVCNCPEMWAMFLAAVNRLVRNPYLPGHVVRYEPRRLPDGLNR